MRTVSHIRYIRRRDEGKMVGPRSNNDRKKTHAQITTKSQRIPTARIFPSRVSGLMGFPVLSSSLQSPCTPMITVLQNSPEVLRTSKTGRHTIDCASIICVFSQTPQTTTSIPAAFNVNVGCNRIFVRTATDRPRITVPLH